jgi:LEA14-like dessication related protein
MNLPLVRVFVATVLATLLSSCVDPGKIIATGLKVELTGIERAADGAVAVSWHVANPNIVPYLLSRETHKVYLNGTLVGTILDAEPLAVPANTNAGRISKLATNEAAARVLADAASTGSATYRVDSEITILIYDESKEKTDLRNTGTVPVRTK